MTDFALARVAFEVTGDALSLARVEANEGAMESARGRYAEGVVAMRRSEERFRALGARSESLQSIRNQVDAQLALLQPQEALATAMRGRSLLSQVQNVDLRCAMQAQVARALAANGRIDEATALLAQTATEVTPGQERTVLGQIRSTQASLELASERALDAAAHARMAVDALASPDDARERAQAWATLVRALASSGDPEAAAGQSASLLDWSTRSSVFSAHVYARLTDAERRWSPQRDMAMAAYDSALTAAEATGVPADIAAVARSWGAMLLAAGDHERASAVVGRLSRWAANDFDCSVAVAGLYRALGQGPPWQAALVRARALAGERPIPVSATAAAD
jgi:tetratricopeptide (TPR) repeat protein